MPGSCTVQYPKINMPSHWKKNLLQFYMEQGWDNGFYRTNQILHSFSPKRAQCLWRLNFTGSKCLQAVLISLVKSRLTGFIGLFRSETLCKAEKEMRLDRNPLTNYLGTSTEIANRLLHRCLSTDALPSSSTMAPHLDLHWTITVNGNGPVHHLLEMWSDRISMELRKINLVLISFFKILTPTRISTT